MYLSPVQQQTRSFIALLAIACVLFLCWSQQSNWALVNCPLQAQHQHADADTSATQVVADCDASGHLLQQAHANILDGGAALTLFIVLVLLALSGARVTSNVRAPPRRRRYRPHLIFCVFNE